MYITINGKEIGIKFNNYAIERFTEILSGWENKTGFAEQYASTYAGYLGWKFVKEDAPGSSFKAPDVSFEEITDWVDSAQENDEIFAQLKEITSMLVMNPVMKKAIETVKKNQITTETPNNSEQTTISSLTES